MIELEFKRHISLLGSQVNGDRLFPRSSFLFWELVSRQDWGMFDACDDVTNSVRYMQKY